MSKRAGDMLRVERFVRKVRRRMIAVRTLERVGIAIMAAMAAALPLMGILIYRGQSTHAVLVGAIALGVASGILWGTIRVPSLLVVAVEVDRQLGLSDLLSTVMTIRDESEMELALRAVGEERCGRLSPKAVVVSHLEPRGWSAIAVTVAMVSGVSLIQLSPGTRAELRTGNEAFVDVETLHERSAIGVADRSASRLDRAVQDVADSGGDQRREIPSEVSKPEPRASGDSNLSIAKDDGSGGGEARSEPRSEAVAIARTSASENDSIGDERGGGGVPQTKFGPGDASGGNSREEARRTQGDTSVAPAGDATSGADGVAGERVPGEFRDLVREYFRRD